MCYNSLPWIPQHVLTDNKRQKAKGPFSPRRAFPGAGPSDRAEPASTVTWASGTPARPHPPPAAGLTSPPAGPGPALPGTHPSREWTRASSGRGRGRGAPRARGTRPGGPPLASGPASKTGSRGEVAVGDLGRDEAGEDRRRLWTQGCEQRSLRHTGDCRCTRRPHRG